MSLFKKVLIFLVSVSCLLACKEKAQVPSRDEDQGLRVFTMSTSETKTDETQKVKKEKAVSSDPNSENIAIESEGESYPEFKPKPSAAIEKVRLSAIEEAELVERLQASGLFIVDVPTSFGLVRGSTPPGKGLIARPPPAATWSPNSSSTGSGNKFVMKINRTEDVPKNAGAYFLYRSLVDPQATPPEREGLTLFAIVIEKNGFMDSFLNSQGIKSLADYRYILYQYRN
ncbi:MAG: hypothetical protein KA436_02605 [Oligoflexales bacterium]|nr:hypothetical protein [Oligoflexales bacterium]